MNRRSKKAAKKPAKWRRTMLILGIIFGLIALMVISMVIQNNRIPSNLGLVDGRLAPMPKSPNAVSSQTDMEDKRVDPLPFNGDLEKSRRIVLGVLESLENSVVVRDEGHYLHVVFTTPTMKFRDDVEFYFDEDSSLIHYRSASRTGYGDMGLNRQRYEEIRRLYTAAQ